MKSLEEMRGWLISKKRRFPGSGMEPLPKWLAELNDEIFQNNEITDAILAALEERTEEKGGVSKEERTEMWQHLDNYLYFHSLKCPICQKIHALFLGTPAPGKK
jgi:hypothetical protein